MEKSVQLLKPIEKVQWHLDDQPVDILEERGSNCERWRSIIAHCDEDESVQEAAFMIDVAQEFWNMNELTK